MTEYLVEGVVECCGTRVRGCGGLLTVLSLSPNPQLKESSLDAPWEMNIVGRHRIDKGEKIRAKYENHSGVLWINGYEILADDWRTVKYSDVSASDI